MHCNRNNGTDEHIYTIEEIRKIVNEIAKQYGVESLFC